MSPSIAAKTSSEIVTNTAAASAAEQHIGLLAAAAATTTMLAKKSPTLAASTTTATSNNIMHYHNIITMLALLLLCGLATVNGLKCHMCGQYNEGVGSITPCLNYSDQYAHLYLKECSKKSEKFCVKYVSGLSTVRDCATECVEKEIWETQTYCCAEDGCNGSNNIKISNALLILPLLCYILNAVFNALQMRR